MVVTFPRGFLNIFLIFFKISQLISILRETLDYMDFPAEFTNQLYNFPLEKCDKLKEYIEDLERKIVIGEANEPYKLKEILCAVLGFIGMILIVRPSFIFGNEI